MSTPPISIRRDIATAYLASFSRIGAWVIISAIVYRTLGLEAFALLALVRGTVGLLNYTSLGIAPAVIRSIAAGKLPVASCQLPVDDGLSPPPLSREPTLPVVSYQSPDADALSLRSIWTNATLFSLMTGAVGLLLALAYALFFTDLLEVSPALAPSTPTVVLCMAAGTIFRLMSDSSGATLQATGRIALDNLLLSGAELIWVLISLSYVRLHPTLLPFAAAYLISGLLLLAARWLLAGRSAGTLWPRWRWANWPLMRGLAAYGLLVTFAQLADFLFAPTDYILINRLISPAAVGIYAPAVQIDAGLLILVSGLAAVLLPRSALAHTAGDTATLRRYYIRGTLASAGILLLASAAVWVLAPWIFLLWFKDPMPQTQAILPLVLIHTTLGGSTAVGRSILLAIGRAKAFTIAVLVTAILNVLLSILFVYQFHWGLKGIIAGTITAALLRGVVWMPWYVMRALKTEGDE